MVPVGQYRHICWWERIAKQPVPILSAHVVCTKFYAIEKRTCTIETNDTKMIFKLIARIKTVNAMVKVNTEKHSRRNIFKNN